MWLEGIYSDLQDVKRSDTVVFERAKRCYLELVGQLVRACFAGSVWEINCALAEFLQEIMTQENIQIELAWCRDRLNTVVGTAPELGQDSPSKGTPTVLSVILEDTSAAQQAKLALGTWKPFLEQIKQVLPLTETMPNVSLFTKFEHTRAFDSF